MQLSNFFVICTRFKEKLTCLSRGERGRDARVVEEARLESVYTPKGYRGFESRFLRTVSSEINMLNNN